MKDEIPAVGCLGEVMLELIPGAGSDAALGVAGDTYNTAVYLAKVAPEHQVDYVTVLGQDGFSDRILSHMEGYNVGGSRVLRHPTRIPGLYAIETDDAGERRFTYWRSAAAARCLGDDDLKDIPSLISGLSHLLFTGISLAILSQPNRDKLFAALADFRGQGGKVVFDSNYRPHLWEGADVARREMERAWRNCDIALPSVDDEMALFGDASWQDVLARFDGYGITTGALKRGEEGPVSLDGEMPELPDRVVQVVDTTAAGDSFNAAYLGALIQGRDNLAAMRAGHDLACDVVGQRGAIIF